MEKKQQLLSNCYFDNKRNLDTYNISTLAKKQFLARKRSLL